MASTAGLEIGVSADRGVGFGLHLIGMNNPPVVANLGIPETEWAFGAAADVRAYFQTVEPLSLYPTFSLGFLAGVDETGHNIVMPMLNPGFGARLKFDNVYVAFEIGAASFYIPFVALSVGFEPERKSHRNDRPAFSQSGPPERQTAVRNARPVPAQYERAVPAQDDAQGAAPDPEKAASEE
jgi:hypothetical protein